MTDTALDELQTAYLALMHAAAPAPHVLERLTSERVLDGVRTHYAALLRWNRTHNLTRVTAPRDAARVHYVDSLLGLAALSPTLEQPADDVLDLGSGAGFPGLMAALLWPDMRITLVDKVRKKASFLTLTARAMQRPHVQVHGERAETVGTAPLVMTRATFSWPNVSIATDCVAPGGTLALFVSTVPEAPSFADVMTEAGLGDCETRTVRVPGVDDRALCMAHRPA